MPGYNLPSKTILDWYVVILRSVLVLDLIAVAFTVFVIFKASNSSIKQYSYFLIHHLAWCAIGESLVQLRGTVSLGENQCFLFYGLDEYLPRKVMLHYLFFSSIASLSRGACEVFLFLFRFAASIHPDSRFYFDIHSIPVWKTFVFLYCLIAINVYASTSRLESTTLMRPFNPGFTISLKPILISPVSLKERRFFVFVKKRFHLT
uniref:Serpentine receptor class gamma n=1 Tax=Bursaphelenchus xylophilus TaxID=6326 RepID=A0A1I7S5J9_BURXY